MHSILSSLIYLLSPYEKYLLQTLAVIGREFSFCLIRNVVSKSDYELNLMLTDLLFREFIYEQPSTYYIEFIFKHSLTQDFAA